MEDFILGLLMVNKITAYQIHQLIKNNYEGICSSSLGNIQRALKILHAKGFVIFTEEGKKKIFEITNDGRKQFMSWISSPPRLTKAKNMETGKILLLGFLSPEKRLEMVDAQIKEIESELEYMLAIEAVVEEQEKSVDIKEFRKNHVAQNKEYFDEVLKVTEKEDVFSLFEDISKFAILTLRYGIDEIKFHLEWLKNIKDKVQ
ncbi:MAG: PadR family transcriptional regulator [Defluviitaleaceae bacterium]|nr:PadR family transcriptional regulator [Defluviitaleaceae bacterium]